MASLPRGIVSSEKGVELLEIALTLPMLAVMLVGIIDFGGGWALKDKLAGAAREGARVAVSQFNDTTTPQCSGTPCSVQAAASAVAQYLNGAGVDTCGLDPSTAAPTQGTFSWTYTSSTSVTCVNTWSIQIERAVNVASNGTNVLCTRVTLNYPYAWTFGTTIHLIAPSLNLGNTLTLSSAEMMANSN